MITEREAKRIARYNAGLIIDAVLGDGWEPQYLIDQYGEDGLSKITNAMMDLGLWLRGTGHPDGIAHGCGGS